MGWRHRSTLSHGATKEVKWITGYCDETGTVIEDTKTTETSIGMSSTVASKSEFHEVSLTVSFDHTDSNSHSVSKSKSHTDHKSVEESITVTGLEGED